MKLKSTADGLSAKPANPFEQYGDAMATEVMEFEANNPELPLVTPMPGNTVFEGDIKYYFEPQDEDYLEWREIDEKRYNTINKNNPERRQKFRLDPIRTCMKYAPLDFKEQVREEAFEKNLEGKAMKAYPWGKASNPELETKATQYGKDLGFEDEMDIEYMADVFKAGYTTRNDEVVAEIECRLICIEAHLKEITDEVICGKLEWQKEELTILLQTIKGLDAPAKKPQ